MFNFRMKKSFLLLTFFVLACQNVSDSHPERKTEQSRALENQESQPITLGYFPSWKQGRPKSDDENGIKNTSLGKVATKSVTHIFLAFARPNLRYIRGSYIISQTGIEGVYTAVGSKKKNGEGLKEHITYLKAQGVEVLLSIGGETYWGSSESYDIKYDQIADLVIDLGFSGIDWDFEPHGSFAQIGTQENIDRFVTFIKETRKALAASVKERENDNNPLHGFNVHEFLIAVAPSGVGSLGRPGNDDPRSPFRYENASQILKRYNSSWGNSANEYRGTSVEDPMGLYGWSSAGHMVEVLKEVGHEIDIVAYQGYNIGKANQPTVLYDAWKFFADIYGFTIAAGVHVPNEPWGPYYTYTEEKVINLAQYIHEGGFEKTPQSLPRRPDAAGARGRFTDGVMVWELEYVSALDNSKNGYSYMDIASKALKGENPQSTPTDNTSQPDKNPQTNNDKNSGTESAITLYSAGQIYLEGDKVSFNGKVYEAKWWTKSEPSETFSWSNAWKLLSEEEKGRLQEEIDKEIKDKKGESAPSEETNSDKIEVWHKDTVYSTAGSLVKYDGATWKNLWWTQGDVPGEGQWGPWEKVGAVSGSEETQKPTTTGNTTTTGRAVTTNDDSQDIDVASWDTNTIYAEKGTLVSYEGAVWKSKWWTQGDTPGATNPSPWEKIGQVTDSGKSTEETTPTPNKIPDSIESPTITSTVASSSRPRDKVVGGYFVEWGVYGRKYEVADIAAEKLSHIIYGFLAICGDNEQGMQDNPEGKRGLDRACRGKEDDTVVIHDPWAALQRSTAAASSWIPDDVILSASDSGRSSTGTTLAGISRGRYRGNYAALFDLKKNHPHLIILPSIGGWTLSDPFYVIAGDEQRRAKFINSLESYLKKYAFWGGVDIDWEYPGGGGASSYGSTADGENYVLLMRDLRSMLDRVEDHWGYDRNYLQLTSAVGQTTQKINNVNFQDASRYMDYIFVMSYDYYGGWSSTLGHHANLKEYEYSKYDGYATTFPVEALIQQGVAKDKIIIGVAMYGRSWEGVSTTGDNDNNPFDGTGGRALSKTSGMWEAGVNDYKQIVNDYLDRDGKGKGDFTYYYDTTAEAPYLWNPKKGIFITYDNQRSTLAKGKYVLDEGLGGLFSWELDADTEGDDSIINAMLKGLE